MGDDYCDCALYSQASEACIKTHIDDSTFQKMFEETTAEACSFEDGSHSILDYEDSEDLTILLNSPGHFDFCVSDSGFILC